MNIKIKTVSDLKRAVDSTGSFFFTRETMAFFWDRMSNYGIRKPAEIQTRRGPVVAIELFRKRPVKHGLQSSAYFCAETFAQVFPSTL